MTEILNVNTSIKKQLLHSTVNYCSEGISLIWKTQAKKFETQKSPA